ncbi:MAG: hypothetical protein R3F49_00455 [Planctomycetota bacterium]
MQAVVDPVQLQAIEEIFERITSDLSMLADREIGVKELVVERHTARPAGAGKIHISFRFGAEEGEQIHHGTLLIPLPDSITLASFLMMLPDDTVRERRGWATLDDSLKDAMLEIGNFVGGAVDAALRALETSVSRVRFEGCQGVRAGVRPALVYREGAPLLVGRAKVTIGSYEPTEMVVIIPDGKYLG